GHPKVQAGRFQPGDLAEAHDDTQLIRVHTKSKSIVGDNGSEGGSHEIDNRARQAGATGRHPPELVPAALEEVFNRRLFGRVAALVVTTTGIPGPEACFLSRLNDVARIAA